MMDKIPERIYLQIYCDGEACSEDELPATNENIYWSEDNIYGDDIEYVLASKVREALVVLKPKMVSTYVPDRVRRAISLLEVAIAKTDDNA